MDTSDTGWLWYVVAIGIVVLGAVLAVAASRTSARRSSPSAQRRTNEATKELYRQEEKDSVRRGES